MSKVDRLLMGCVYLILGIPLIYISTQTPEVENMANVNFKNPDSFSNFLNYPQNAVIAGDIGRFQKLLCAHPPLLPGPWMPGSTSSSNQTNSRCKDILKNAQKFDWSDNAFKLNRLRMACFIIGIILCVIAFFKFVQHVAPKSYNLKQKMKKLQKSKKKKK